MTNTPTARGTATRDRIVAAAAELMYRDGAAATTTPALRDAAGVSSSQIYHYFADKDALTEAVISWWADRIVADQVALLGRVRDLRGLQRWKRSIVIAGADHGGCPLGGLAAELADRTWARTISADGFRRWQLAIRDTLARLVERGVLAASTDVERHSLALLVAIQGGLLISRATHDTRALEVGLDTALRDLRTDLDPVTA